MLVRGLLASLLVGREAPPDARKDANYLNCEVPCLLRCENSNATFGVATLSYDAPAPESYAEDLAARLRASGRDSPGDPPPAVVEGWQFAHTPFPWLGRTCADECESACAMRHSTRATAAGKPPGMYNQRWSVRRYVCENPAGFIGVLLELQAHSTASQKSITAPWYLVAALALSCVARTLIMVAAPKGLAEDVLTAVGPLLATTALGAEAAKRLVRKHFKLPSNAAFGVGQVFQLAVLVAGVSMVVALRDTFALSLPDALLCTSLLWPATGAPVRLWLPALLYPWLPEIAVAVDPFVPPLLRILDARALAQVAQLVLIRTYYTGWTVERFQNVLKHEMKMARSKG